MSLRSLGRIVLSDMRYGIPSAAPRLVAVAAAGALVFFLSFVRTRVYLPHMEGALTLGENVLCVWRGMLPYDPASGEPFPFPMHWFTLLAAMLYVVLDYPVRDLDGMGTSLIVAARGRWAWWLAKCLWAVACGLLCWLIPLALCAAIAVADGGGLTLAVRPGLAAVLDAGDSARILEATEALVATQGASVSSEAAFCDLSAPVAVSLTALFAVMLVQTAVSLLVHPFAGLFASMSALFLSAYFDVWWLPGNYLMLARSEVLLDGGVDPAVGCLLSFVIAALCVVLGGAVFNLKDLLGRRGGSS